MKEDILEQLVDEYLQHKGYFTRHNIKFKPDSAHTDYVKNQDSNHSDIDVLGYNPKLSGAARVFAVSCKSWQGGFWPESKIREIEENKIVSGREAWKSFRELVSQKWAQAFREAIYQVTGATEFTYVTAVTLTKGNKETWENHQKFIELMNGNPIRILTFSDILDEVMPSLNTTQASTEIGRFLQLVKASGWLKRE